jgi:hypothetical protein
MKNFGKYSVLALSAVLLFSCGNAQRKEEGTTTATETAAADSLSKAAAHWKIEFEESAFDFGQVKKAHR